MSMLLLPLEVLLVRVNDRDRRQVVVLGGLRYRVMVGEGGIAHGVILVIGGICLLHLRGLEVIWIGCECLYSRCDVAINQMSSTVELLNNPR